MLLKTLKLLICIISLNTICAKEITYTIKANENLHTILKKQNLNIDYINNLTSIPEIKKNLSKIYPGQILIMDIENNKLLKLSIKKSKSEKSLIEINLKKNQSKLNKQKSHQIISKTNNQNTKSIKDNLIKKTGLVKKSFFDSAIKSGIPETITKELIYLFNYKINFNKDISPNSKFGVLYSKNENSYNIHMAFLHTHNKKIEIFNFNNKGFYDKNAKNIKTSFIREPLKYNRISSAFNLNRMHPVLKIKRPHKGVDFAAPQGEPVMASSDGKIIFLGDKNNGYGNYIKIKHDSKYETLYAHLQKFAPDLTMGSEVKQNQIIGYVGMTGMATGPHLHYEFIVNGHHENPMTVELPELKKISNAELESFFKEYNKMQSILID